MYANKLGIEIGCCTRSMSKKGDGKSGDFINSSKSKPKDNTENIVEKTRPSTPRSCKKTVSYSENKTGSNNATDSPGPLTRGKRKSLSVRSSVKNISDYFDKEQPKNCEEINKTTHKKVDVEKSGIDIKSVLSDDNNHITNTSDLIKNNFFSYKNLRVVVNRAPEFVQEYCNLEENKDGSKIVTNKDKNYHHSITKESLQEMDDNIKRSNDTVKKYSNDLKSKSPSNKDVTENNDTISPLKKKSLPNNSINSKDLNPVSNNSDSNLPETKEKGDVKFVAFEMKKTDENVEKIDNFIEKSLSFSQLVDKKSKINKQIESSIKKTDVKKPTTPIKSPGIMKKSESPEEQLSLATCTRETSIKTAEKCPLGRSVEKAKVLNALIKTESLTSDLIGNEKKEHDSKDKSCDDCEDIMSPQEFLREVFNKQTASPDSDKNENRLSAIKEKKKDESKIVENVVETTKSNSSSIHIESEESDSKNKTKNAIIMVENEKPVADSESATNIPEDNTGKLENKSLGTKADIVDKEKGKQLQKKQESGIEKKDEDTVPNESCSPRTHAETEALTGNKRESIEATVPESDDSQNKPTSKLTANTPDKSQQLVVTSITTDSVPKTKRLSSPEKDAAIAKPSQKEQQDELKETGETMIEADNISSISDKKNPNTPSKQSTAGHTNETSLMEENKVISDSNANDLESHERMSKKESEQVKSDSSIRSPNTSIRIIDLQEDPSMSGVEEIPEVIITEQKSVVDIKEKDFSTESNCEIISTGAIGNVHSEVTDVIEDILINVNKSRTCGKRSFDDENYIAGNKEKSLRSVSKNKKLKCAEKEDDESSNIGDKNIVSGRDENDEEGKKSEQDKDRGGSLDIDDKDVPPTKASLVKRAEEGLEEIIDKNEVVESSESGDKNIDSGKECLADEPEEGEVEKVGESKGIEDEDIVLGKALLDESEEGDGNGESCDSESRDVGSQKNFLDEETEGDNIEKVMIDESSDSSGSNMVSVQVFFDDEADEGEEEIANEVKDEESDESVGNDIVSGSSFLDSGGKEEDEIVDDDESDSVDDREILSGKDFLDEEAEERDEEIGEDTDDESGDTDGDGIISGKYFFEDESDKDEGLNELEEISEEYSKTNVKNTVSIVNMLKDKANKTKEKVKIEKKKFENTIVKKNIAENENDIEKDEDVLSNNSGETVSNDELISLDKSEEYERITALKTNISRSDETKSISHASNKGSWTVSSIKGSSKIKNFNNKICTNNVKFVATEIDGNKKSFGETNMLLNNNLNWIISTVEEDKDFSNSKKEPKKSNQLKRKLESVTKKESSSVSSTKEQASTKDDELVVQENPDLYDSLLLKRKRSKKKSKQNPVKEDNVELLDFFASSATVEDIKSLSMPSTSGKIKESIKNAQAFRHSMEEDNVPKMHNLDEQNEGMRYSLKRFSDAIEVYKKKLKVTRNTEKMDKNCLRNTNKAGVEFKKYPFRITVGNVPESVTPNELKSTFSQVGFNDIVAVSPIMDSVEMKFAVVTFSSRNSQQRALKYYGQLFLKGNPLFPMQCHQDDHVDNVKRESRKYNLNPTAESQKHGKAHTKYNKHSKNENHSKDKSKVATDMTGVSQNRNLEQSTNHLSKQKSKQKSVLVKNNMKPNMNKTDDVNKLSQKKPKLKGNVHVSKSEENAAIAWKISGNTDLTSSMGDSEYNSVNIKCLGNIRPSIKEVKEAFSVVGITDVESINQVSKNVTSVEFASKESVEKLLSSLGKIVINGMPVLIKEKNTLQSSPDLSSTSTANIQSKKVKKQKHQHNVNAGIDKEHNSDSAAQNRRKDFALIIKNLPTNSSNTNVRKSLTNLGMKGVTKVIIKRDENDNKDKLTGVVNFINERFYLNALNTKNILVNGSQVKFIPKKKNKRISSPGLLIIKNQ